MQTKLISQTGLKVRTNCRLGYYSFVPSEGNPLTINQKNNNYCISTRDLRTLNCALKLWPQDGGVCTGNNNGKELDRCMGYVWGPEELNTYRSQGGTPYNSEGGDKCFNEFYVRHQQRVAPIENWKEWENCLRTVP